MGFLYVISFLLFLISMTVCNAKHEPFELPYQTSVSSKDVFNEADLKSFCFSSVSLSGLVSFSVCF